MPIPTRSDDDDFAIDGDLADGEDFFGRPTPPPAMTKGRKARVELLRSRVDRGLALWNEADKIMLLHGETWGPRGPERALPPHQPDADEDDEDLDGPPL